MRLSVLPLCLLVGACSAFLNIDDNFWYDSGLLGAYPTVKYNSFNLRGPRVNVLRWDPRCDFESYNFLEPRGHSVQTPGPLILDAGGNLVWTDEGEAMDVKVQHWRDKDYITFWRGADDGTFGRGTYYMLNETYEVERTVSPGGDFDGDLHEFKITEQGTALMTIYEPIEVDLSSFGIGKGWIYDSLFQEMDIDTGKVLFQWRASEHYTVEETYADIGPKGRDKTSGFDFFHINSISKDPEGNYYISSRYMHTVTAIKPDGEIKWILGGRRNMFKDLSQGAASNFSWQHHMEWHENDTITLFDNGAYNSLYTADYSRGLLISLDVEALTATLIQDYVTDAHYVAHSQGSIQMLPDGHVFVGWGHSPAYTEFTHDGQILCHTRFGAKWYFKHGRVKSYRTMKSKWVGRPNTQPSLAMTGLTNPILRNLGARNKLYVSWNGATEVKGWSLQTADAGRATHNHWETILSQPKLGFETEFDLPQDTVPFVRVAALGPHGEVLEHSGVMDRRSGKMIPGNYRSVEAPPYIDSDLIIAIILFIITIIAFAAATLYFVGFLINSGTIIYIVRVTGVCFNAIGRLVIRIFHSHLALKIGRSILTIYRPVERKVVAPVYIRGKKYAGRAFGPAWGWVKDRCTRRSAFGYTRLGTKDSTEKAVELESG